jgi:hypothetical protein
MEWTYYRLVNDEGHVIGFIRECGGVCHYVGIKFDRWQTEPIEHVDRYKLAGPLPGMGYLKEPQ